MDEIKQHKIEHNGNEYKFDVFKDLTEPCSQCGVPACGKENYFWINEKGRRQTLILDGELLDLIIEQYFTVNIKKVKYDSLPKFLTESNENKGWSEADNFEGRPIDVDDLLLSIEKIRIDELENWIEGTAKEYLKELKRIAIKANKEETELYVARN